MNLTEFLSIVSMGLAIWLVVGHTHMLARYKVNMYFRDYSLFSILVYVLMTFGQLWALLYLNSTLWPFKLYVVCVGIKGLMGLRAIKKVSIKK